MAATAITHVDQAKAQAGAPDFTLGAGLENTYAWIYDQIVNKRPCPVY